MIWGFRLLPEVGPGFQSVWRGSSSFAQLATCIVKRSLVENQTSQWSLKFKETKLTTKLFKTKGKLLMNCMNYERDVILSSTLVCSANNDYEKNWTGFQKVTLHPSGIFMETYYLLTLLFIILFVQILKATLKDRFNSTTFSFLWTILDCRWNQSPLMWWHLIIFVKPLQYNIYKELYFVLCLPRNMSKSSSRACYKEKKI